MSKSYTTEQVPIGQVIRSGWVQWRSVRHQARQAAAKVGEAIAWWSQLADETEQLIGISLHNLDWLEIGCGQSPLSLAFFASRGNRVTGVDLDIVPQGLMDFRTWADVLRYNGPMRFAKSLMREFSGINRAARREFCRQLDLIKWPSYRTLWMDATQLRFPDNSFDFIWSYGVFEHISQPQLAISEITRVLRPGGWVRLTFVHYEWYNALHDLRGFIRTPDAPVGWAHLIPSLAQSVQQGAYVNKIRLSAWREMFKSAWPASRFDCAAVKDPRLLEQFNRHRAAGHLANYTEKELLTDHITVVWCKPITGK